MAKTEERTADQKAKAHKACLDGADTINVLIATHNKGDKFDKDEDGNDIIPFAYDLTHEEKKERIARSVGYLKYQKALEDWGSEDFTVIDKAIADADKFTGAKK
tara:strand:+ start:4186 stop:4497 length:312 start_codon:yes stop_codon:yes gene_type:complete